MFRKIWNNFLAGIAVILPVILTLLVVRFLVAKLDSLVMGPLAKLFYPYLEQPYMVYLIKAAFILIIFMLVALAGLATRIVVTRRVFGLLEKVLIKVPMVNKIYATIKELSLAFLGQGKRIFKSVVLIEYPRKGVYSVAFVTSEGKGEIQVKTQKQCLSVFVPTVPNPTSGIYLLVPKQEAIPLDMSVQEGLKLVISGGAVAPDYGHPKDRGSRS